MHSDFFSTRNRLQLLCYSRTQLPPWMVQDHNLRVLHPKGHIPQRLERLCQFQTLSLRTRRMFCRDCSLRRGGQAPRDTPACKLLVFLQTRGMGQWQELGLHDLACSIWPHQMILLRSPSCDLHLESHTLQVKLLAFQGRTLVHDWHLVSDKSCDGVQSHDWISLCDGRGVNKMKRWQENG